MLPVLLLALACGEGEDRPIDVGVWLAPPNEGPVDVAGVRVGRPGLESLGAAYGAYALSPDRKRVFLELDRGAAVVSVDGARHTLADSYRSDSFRWSVDGTRTAFLEGDSLLIADASAAHGVRVPAPDEWNGAPVWSPDGSKLAIEGASGIFIVDVASNEASMASTLHVDGTGGAMLWAPDSNSLAVKNEGALQIVDVRGNTFAEVMVSGFNSAWSADGAWLALGACGSPFVVISADGSTRTELDTGCGYPIWSPSAAKLLYSTDTGIFLWSAQEQSTVTLFSGLDATLAGWSPDGQKLAFVRLEAGTPRTRIVDVADESTLSEFDGALPTWNKDGTRLAFLEGDSLRVAEADGAHPKTAASGVESFVWLPDDNHLAFFRSTSIETAAWDGSQLTSIATLKPGLHGWLPPDAH